MLHVSDSLGSSSDSCCCCGVPSPRHARWRPRVAAQHHLRAQEVLQPPLPVRGEQQLPSVQAVHRSTDGDTTSCNAHNHHQLSLGRRACAAIAKVAFPCFSRANMLGLWLWLSCESDASSRLPCPLLFSLFRPQSAEEGYRGPEGDSSVVDRLILTSGKMVLLDKLLRRLKETGHRVLIFSQMVGGWAECARREVEECQLLQSWVEGGCWVCSWCQDQSNPCMGQGGLGMVFPQIRRWVGGDAPALGNRVLVCLAASVGHQLHAPCCPCVQSSTTRSSTLLHPLPFSPLPPLGSRSGHHLRLHASAWLPAPAPGRLHLSRRPPPVHGAVQPPRLHRLCVPAVHPSRGAGHQPGHCRHGRHL